MKTIEFLKKNIEEITKTIGLVKHQLKTKSDPTLSNNESFLKKQLRYLKGVKDAYEFVLWNETTDTIELSLAA